MNVATRNSLTLLLTLTLATPCLAKPGREVPAEPRPSVETRYSGFLGDYSGLRTDPNDKSLEWYEADDFSWLDYHAVMIDPLVVSFSTTTKRQEIKTKRIHALESRLRQAVEKALGPEHPVVTEPAEGVLRIRVAITDIRPANPTLNVVTSLVVPVRFDSGGASIEVEFLNAETGERVAAAVDRKAGSKLKVWQGFKRWGDTRAAFRTWGKELKNALETNPDSDEQAR